MAAPAGAKYHLRFFPLFADDSPQDWGTEMRRPAVNTLLKKYIEIGSFKAEPGQILSLPDQGIILGGLVLGKTGIRKRLVSCSVPWGLH